MKNISHLGVSPADLGYLPEFKIELRCNNQVAVTRQRLADKKQQRYENLYIPKLSRGHLDALIVRDAERQGCDSYYDSKLRAVRLVRNLPDVASISPLDLISKFQDKKIRPASDRKDERKGWGAKPRVKSFTHKAGQKIRECGAAIDIVSGGRPDLCRVVTLTFAAGDNVRAFEVMSLESGYAINRLLQVFRDDYRGEVPYWFYVWEHQARGALHLHLCHYHPDPVASQEIGEKLISKWRDILIHISNKYDVDLLYSPAFGCRVELAKMQCRNEEMRKGCGGYFSKYGSKKSDSSNVKAIDIRNADLYPPSSWWGRSHGLVRICKENSFSFKFKGIDGTDSETLRDKAFEILSQKDITMTDSFCFKKEIETCDGTLTICEGITEVFYVSPAHYQELLTHYRYTFGSTETSTIPERALRNYHKPVDLLVEF